MWTTGVQGFDTLPNRRGYHLQYRIVVSNSWSPRPQNVEGLRDPSADDLWEPEFSGDNVMQTMRVPYIDG